MNKIRIVSGDIDIELNLKLLVNQTAEKIKAALPIKSRAKTWGDEIYFDTGIKASAEDATTDVDIGDMAYWPEGKCLCIFFGKTPMSSGNKPVPASEVVIIGKIALNPDTLRKVKPGAQIIIE